MTTKATQNCHQRKYVGVAKFRHTCGKYMLFYLHFICVAKCNKKRFKNSKILTSCFATKHQEVCLMADNGLAKTWYFDFVISYLNNETGKLMFDVWKINQIEINNRWKLNYKAVIV